MLQKQVVEEGDDLLQAQMGGGQTPEVAPGLASRIRSLQSGGQPLPHPARAFFEPRFGADFSRVRVHTNAEAAASAKALNAKAYTLGQNVVFGAGQYQPGTRQGRRLLAHELTHTLHQRTINRSLIQRDCDCSRISGARTPTTVEEQSLMRRFPNLRRNDWCITGPRTRQYNCHAFAAGNQTEFRTGPDIDRRWGNRDGRVTHLDFDDYYKTESGLQPAEDYCPADARVVLFASGGSPKHSARIVNNASGTIAESKLGRSWRIVHYLNQLEGGPYGDIVRY